MVTIIKDNSYTIVAEGVKPDYKKRVVLPKNLVPEGITYHIYHNYPADKSKVGRLPFLEVG